MADPTAAEIEAGAEALSVQARPTRRDRQRAEMVLRAVLPDHDARVRAEERARVAEEIARDIEAAADAHLVRIAEIAGVPGPVRDGMESAGIRRGAVIARAHATPPTTEEDHQEAASWLIRPPT